MDVGEGRVDDPGDHVGLEEVHLHPRRLAVGRRRHVRVVGEEDGDRAPREDGDAVHGLGVQRVASLARSGVVHRLEVAGRLVESDRRGGEMVVEEVHEVEDLGRGLAAVGQPRAVDEVIPGAASARAVAERRVDRRVGVDPVAARARRRLLEQLGSIRGVDVEVDVGVVALQAIGRGQPRPEVAGGRDSALRRARVGVPRQAVRPHDAVGAPQQRAGRRIDDRVVEPGRARDVRDPPREGHARAEVEEDEARRVPAREPRQPLLAGDAQDARGQSRCAAGRRPRGDGERLAGGERGIRARGTREPGTRRSLEGEHAPAARHVHADGVVEGGDAASRLRPAQVGHAVG